MQIYIIMWTKPRRCRSNAPALLQILLCSAQIIPSGLTERVFDDRTSSMSSLFKGDRERKRASAILGRVIRFSNEPSAIFFVVLGRACSGQHARGSSLAGTGPLGMQAVL